MSAFGRVLVGAALARGATLRLSERHLRAVQTAALTALVARSHATAFGRAHGFASIRSVRDFRDRVPLRRYAALEPFFARARAGEPDVVWPGRIPYFGMSGGTTAGNKYLPISMASVRQQQLGGFEPIAAYLRATRDATLFDGAAILLGGSTRLEHERGGVLVGDNTGIMGRHVPELLARARLPSPEVAAIADWEAKLDALAEEAAGRDVRLIAGTPSWFTGLFDRVLDVAARRRRGARRILDVWPNLRLLTGGGVRYEPYARLIDERLGGPVPYLDIYNATEGGIMAVQESVADPAMTLLPDNGVFYELVPLEDVDAERPRRLGLWEAERGGVYALAVSTMSGLFGYVIGDCLRFVEVDPPRVLFESRTAAFLNVTGEHVSQGEIERAAARAVEDAGLVLSELTVGADVGVGQGTRHVWFLETGVPDDAERITASVAAAIDEALARGNGDYAARRTSRAGLLVPTVRLLPRGTFDRWMAARGKLGGQNKVPRVLLDPALRRALEDVARAAADGRRDLLASPA